MKSFPLTISRIQDETQDAYTLYFTKPEATSFQEYLSGQYLTLTLHINGESIRRAFSLSSSPATDTQLAITIKRIPHGKASNYLRDTLKLGDTITCYPPMGKFCLSPSPDQKRHYIMIGAGSGITPLISMLKTALAVEGKSKVTLIYGNRNENSIIFQEELARLVEKFSGRLSVIHVLSQPEGDWKGKTGRIDAQMLTEFLRDLFMQDDFKKSYYLCGPADMMDTATQVLDAQGVFPDLIHREFFEAPAPSDEEIEAVHGEKPVGFAHTIQLTLDGIHYKVMVQPDQYILDAAIEQGIDPPYACQSGICTTCRAKLISGKVKMDEDEGLSKDEIKQGFVLTCQAKCIEGDIAVEYI